MFRAGNIAGLSLREGGVDRVAELGFEHRSKGGSCRLHDMDEQPPVQAYPRTRAQGRALPGRRPELNAFLTPGFGSPGRLRPGPARRRQLPAHAARLWLASLSATPSVNCDAFDDAGQLVCAVEPAPFFEAARTRVKTISSAVFCDSPLVPHGAMADGGEDALDRVRGAADCLGGEIVRRSRKALPGFGGIAIWIIRCGPFPGRCRAGGSRRPEARRSSPPRPSAPPSEFGAPSRAIWVSGSMIDPGC